MKESFSMAENSSESFAGTIATLNLLVEEARDVDAFPVILHRLLSNMEAGGTEDIISWSPDGKSFVIHQPKAFVDTIMTRYFKNQTRYKSFQVCDELG